MEKDYVVTFEAKADGHNLTVGIIGGQVVFTFSNSTMPLLVASVIRTQGCVASEDGVKKIIQEVA